MLASFASIIIVDSMSMSEDTVGDAACDLLYMLRSAISNGALPQWPNVPFVDEQSLLTWHASIGS